MSKKRIDGLWERIYSVEDSEVNEVLRQAAIEAELLEDAKYLSHVEILMTSYSDAMADMATVEF